MTERGFEPLTSQLGIAGTSYRIQLGMINDKWASRILKGREVIDSYVYREEDSAAGGLPNSNLIVGWVLRTVAIPNINPHQIMKTTQALVKQAVQNKEDKKMVPSVAESKDVELEKVPENEIKRATPKGWVKEEGMKSVDEIEEEKRRAFQERVKAIKEEKGTSEVASAIKTSRTLPSIPSASAQTENIPSREELEGIKCSSCGNKIIYCPYCGKKLPH